MQKYGKVEETGGTVIFESKDFSEGEKMFFKVKINKECKKDLGYKYYSTSEEIYSATTDYTVSNTFSESTSVNGKVTSSVEYYTIEKKSSEYKGSNGNYLLLNIDCNGGKIDFQNTEKDQSTSSIILVVCLVVGFIVFVGIIVGICCYCSRKRQIMRSRVAMDQPYAMYGNPQMYPQPGNMPIVYGGQPVVIAPPNGIPNNSNMTNIQYANINANASMSQMNQLPNQKYNMIDQSSAERGYNINAINEKGGN